MLDAKKLDTLREAQSKDNSPVEQVLLNKNLVTDRDIALAYAEHLQVPLYELPAEGPTLDRELSQVLPEKLCRDQLIVPIAKGETVDVAFVSPHEMLIIDELQLITGCVIRPLITTQSIVERLVEYLFNSENSSNDFTSAGSNFEQMSEEEDVGKGDSSRDDEILHLDQPPPPGQDGRVIRQVNQILEQARAHGPAISIWSRSRKSARSVCVSTASCTNCRLPRGLNSSRSSRGSRFWPRWISPKNACPRTVRSRSRAAISGSTGASTRCRPSMARRWSCVFWTRAPPRTN